MKKIIDLSVHMLNIKIRTLKKLKNVNNNPLNFM